MIHLIDTHSHLYDPAFDTDIDDVMARATECGVSTIILPAIDSNSHQAQAHLASRAEHLFAQMMGVHPTSIGPDYSRELAVAEQLLNEAPDRYVAIGEIGLDYYWDTTYAAEQRAALEQQLQWANRYGKPVCLHVRNAYNDIFEVLDRCPVAAKGVFHCFSGTAADAAQAIAMGYMLGIGGVVTFKKSALAEIVHDVPLEKIVLETDAPYLAPSPHRGTRNESAYCSIIAQKIAEIKNITVEEVAQTTTRNAQQLFGLKPQTDI